jgi:hypothetical protein
MRYLTLYTPDEKTAALPPSAEHMAAMQRLSAEMQSAGVLLANGAFLATSPTKRLRSVDGVISVLDGPSPDSVDRVRGFALLEVKSKEEALELVERFLEVAGDGDCELRPLLG